MPIVLSEHANKQLRERYISKKRISETVRNPDRIQASFNALLKLGIAFLAVFDILYLGMNKQEKTQLVKSYEQYRKKKIGNKGILHFLRGFMPEIIFRTTKLEGESVTRKMVSLLFK